MAERVLNSELLHGIGMAEQPDVIHWYDLTCPFCYVGQGRDDILKGNGVLVVTQPFQAHPDIPPEGIEMGHRSGPMYDRLEAEARNAGLPLRWPSRLPNSRLALGVAEWVRIHDEPAAATLRKDLYAAHFARGEDIGDTAVVERYASDVGVSLDALREAIANGATETVLANSERLGRVAGVMGTPAWLIQGHMVSGLQPPAVFEQFSADR